MSIETKYYEDAIAIRAAALDLLAQARAVEWGKRDFGSMWRCPSCQACGARQNYGDSETVLPHPKHAPDCALAAAIAAMAKALGVP